MNYSGLKAIEMPKHEAIRKPQVKAKPVTMAKPSTKTNEDTTSIHIRYSNPMYLKGGCY